MTSYHGSIDDDCVHALVVGWLVGWLVGVNSRNNVRDVTHTANRQHFYDAGRFRHHTTSPQYS